MFLLLIMLYDLSTTGTATVTMNNSKAISHSDLQKSFNVSETANSATTNTTTTTITTIYIS